MKTCVLFFLLEQCFSTSVPWHIGVPQKVYKGATSVSHKEMLGSVVELHSQNPISVTSHESHFLRVSFQVPATCDIMGLLSFCDLEVPPIKCASTHVKHLVVCRKMKKVGNRCPRIFSLSVPCYT